MEVSYYPGCSLEGTAREYGESTKIVASLLGVQFHELDDWSCCGASSAHATNEELALGLSVRNLRIADKTGLDLVVPCAACYQRLKRAEKSLLSEASSKYQGTLSIVYAVDFFWRYVGEKAIRERLKKPLRGLSPVCYYGCLALRPPRITGAMDPEYPEAMDNLMKTIGAVPRKWTYKTDCCGGSHSFTRPDIAVKLTDKLLSMAREAGANCIVTGCPLCQSNLDMGQQQILNEGGPKYEMPIFYFTELMGLAFGEPVSKWLRGHAIDPKPLLKQIGLS